MAPHKVTGMVAVAFWKTPMLGTRPRHGTLHENLASAETLPRRQNDVPAKLNRDTFPLWAEEATKTPLHNLGLNAKKFLTI